MRQPLGTAASSRAGRARFAFCSRRRRRRRKEGRKGREGKGSEVVALSFPWSRARSKGLLATDDGKSVILSLPRGL